MYIKKITILILLGFIPTLLIGQSTVRDIRDFNDWYRGEYLNHVAFPLGGMGAGMFCIEGSGALSHLSVRNRPEIFNEPCAFAAISVKGYKNGAKVLQGQVPGWKLFGRENTGNGLGGTSFGLPRFETSKFLAHFPFAHLKLEDQDIPLDVSVTAWSPFTPRDDNNSSLPVASIEYTFRNLTGEPIEALFSWNSRNFMKITSTSAILPTQNGFILHQDGNKEHPEHLGDFAVFTDDNHTVVNHCWFRGGWWDPLTMAWNTIEKGEAVRNDPVGQDAPGASLFVPFTLEPDGEKTICLMFAWYVPNSIVQYGTDPTPTGSAFGKSPSAGTAPNQQMVNGYIGEGLVNTYDPSGDGLTGTLTSPDFKINRKYIKFLIGGGNFPRTTCINLVVGDKTVRTATGKNNETLFPVTWDVSEFKNKSARITIIDQETGGWGHINVDQITLCDDPSEALERTKNSSLVTVLHDFEGNTYGDWIVTSPEGIDLAGVDIAVNQYYKPWYASRFGSIEEVITYWQQNYDNLRQNSSLFSDALYASTLPPEVMEAISANLTILKSPTVLRQHDGRLWNYEGCSDNWGCCHGSCTHVWNYAQAIPHLFPSLERTLRETEFFVSQNEEGHQTFRSNLPIRPVTHTFHAASDGQLGGIMKVYRDWRISGNTEWMKKMYQKVKQSLDYCIEIWDPRHKGVLEEPHHNTYDIEFWGPDGMCSSFYLGALSAFVEMSKAMNEPAELYRELLEKGKKYMESELYNGEYFIQQIKWEGLNATLEMESARHSYTPEAFELLKQEGPKYQYGTGCLSDGILGMWLASVSGLDEVINEKMITSHLISVYKYNLKKDLRDHPNPQRPTFACGNEGGLLLCTWPKSDQLSLPFVYSNEVWTGIEYQVAGHLMMKGKVDEGLDIVRACRERYDGRIRNPFDEIECGHWYARALASYAMFQSLTGVRYDAVDKTLFIDSKIGDDFTSFLSTETGFGNVGLKKGEPFLDMKFGDIDVEKVVVSGKEMKL